MKLLIHGILINRYSADLNFKSMTQILSTNIEHSFRAVYSYEAYEIVKNSSKSHLLSSSEWLFFIEQYVQFKKFDELFRNWHQATLEDKQRNLETLRQNTARLGGFIKRLDDSIFLKSKLTEMDHAKDHEIERALRNEGRSAEEINSILWAFKRNRENSRADLS